MQATQLVPTQCLNIFLINITHNTLLQTHKTKTNCMQPVSYVLPKMPD